MPAALITRPEPVNFTDNVSKYLLAGSFTNASQKFQVRIYVEDGSTPKVTEMYPPGPFSTLAFSINETVRSFISYTRPKITPALLSTIQQASHSVKAWIDYRIFDPTTGTQPAFVSDAAFPRRYIKGGYGLWGNLPNFDFVHKRKWFFTWEPAGKLVGPKEPHWLLYCHPVGETADLEYMVTYTDGSTGSTRVPITLTNTVPAERQFDTYFIPTGVEQCSLHVLNAAKMIFKYRVRVLKRTDSTVLAEYDYRVDYRPNYNAFVLYYRNSLGGWDSLRILGEWEEANTYTRKDYQRDIFPAYSNFDPDSIGALPIYDSRERRKWKVNSGHLSKNDLDRLRELMLSREMAIIKNGTWLPVLPTSDTLSGMNTREALQNITLEFQAAFENTNYTPDTLPWTLDS